MFTPPDSESDIRLEERENQVSENEKNVSEISSDDIHTMPDKFFRTNEAPQTKGRVSWLVLGTLFFVVVGSVIVALFLYFTRQDDVVINSNDFTALGTNFNLSTTTPSDINDDVTEDIDLTDPKSRDEKRLSDIYDLKSALALYFAKYEEYPVSLNTLLRDFLTIIPENPTPGGMDYDYKVTSDQFNFELTFSLETGGLLGNLNLDAEIYVLTPEGINIYIDPDSLLPDDVELDYNLSVIQMGLDSDQDGLTDIEENIYKTNSTLLDSDSDSYDDAIEILALYDPAKADGRLLDSEVVTTYQNTNYYYSVIYPTSWTARSLTPDKKEVIFTSAMGEFFEVIILNNPLGLSAYNWYLTQNPGVDPKTLSTLLIDGLPAVKSPDGLTTYLGVGSNIFILTYNIGTNRQTNFYTTYRLFSEKLIFIDPSSIETGETSTTTNQ